MHLLLSMITPLGWLERVPTYKEQIENIKGKDLHTYGFLGYPVLQTADIVIYGEPGMSLAVPVGEDQVAHVELSREVVRRFNFSIGFAIDDDLRNDHTSVTQIAGVLKSILSSTSGLGVPIGRRCLGQVCHRFQATRCGERTRELCSFIDGNSDCAGHVHHSDRLI